MLVKFTISRLYLLSVAEQAGLSVTLSETPKTGFLMTWLIDEKGTTTKQQNDIGKQDRLFNVVYAWKGNK